MYSYGLSGPIISSSECLSASGLLVFDFGSDFFDAFEVLGFDFEAGRTPPVISVPGIPFLASSADTVINGSFALLAGFFTGFFALMFIAFLTPAPVLAFLGGVLLAFAVVSLSAVFLGAISMFLCCFSSNVKSRDSKQIIEISENHLFRIPGFNSNGENLATWGTVRSNTDIVSSVLFHLVERQQSLLYSMKHQRPKVVVRRAEIFVD